MQNLQLGSALAALVAAALHGCRQLIRPAKGADEQGHQNGDQGFGPLNQTAGLKVRTPGLLGGHDLIRLLNEGGNEPQGNAHHHGQLVHRQAQLLQGPQQRLQAVGEGNGRRGIGQQEGAGNQHDDPGGHKNCRPDPLPGDGDAPKPGQHMVAAGVKQIQHRRQNHNDHNGLHAPQNGLGPNPGQSHRHHQKRQHQAVAHPAASHKQGHNIQYRHQELRPRVQPMYHGFAWEKLTQGNIL